MSILAIEALHASYGPVRALRGISLELAAGEIVSVVGANGAGKSTMLRTLSGLVRAAGGRIVLDGRDITRLPSHRRVALGLMHVPEGRAILQTMTVAENLTVAREHGRAPKSDTDAVLALFPMLRDRMAQLAGLLSGGQQQMLAIARALIASPRVLLLDEPSLGLAPLVVQEILRLVVSLRSHGMSILLVEQNVRAALAVSDRTYVLELGRVKASGRSCEIAAQTDLLSLYLGGRAAQPENPP